VWAATTAGAGAYDLKAKTWRIYDQNNTVMNEPWCYGVAISENRVFLGIWASGILEYDPASGLFKAYRDPDGEFHLQLAENSGPVIDITSGVAYADGMLWQATYFGLSRYNTRNGTWRTWVQDKSPLASNFINTVFAHRSFAWLATDRGVSSTDGDTWVNYAVDDEGHGSVAMHRPGQPAETRAMSTALCDPFVLATWADDHEIWFGTSNGISHGIFAAATTQTGNGTAKEAAP
jgi:ligand-binding sensor domain-containing protein